jgi:CubicO group peptidase (beta-lactamase class C family)
MLVLDKFVALAPIIQDICNVSGIPGVSLGVLHNNEVVHTASFGYADVEKQIPCDSDTVFVLGSLSKAMTAALIASLRDDGALSSWDQPLKTLLPDFHRADIYGEITLADLLTHRTGLASLDSLWLASDNVPFLPRSQAVPILDGAPGIRPFRSHFAYNNFAYEILGQIVETASGKTFAEALQQRLLDPLGMNRTYYTGVRRENEAKPYAALEDASVVGIAPALAGEDVLMGPAGGIRSSVNDLLALYKAFMDAAHHEMTYAKEKEPPPKPKHVLRRVRQLWQGQIPLPSRSLREHSYAFGWARAQLPAILSPGDDGPSELNPVVGTGAPSRLAVYHGGDIPGYSTHAALFPETGSGVVVLSNSMSLNGGVRWLGELLVEALFDNLANAPDYRVVAGESARRGAQRARNVNARLAAGRTVERPTRPLREYVGRYVNAVGNFFVQIQWNADKSGIEVAYMGRRADTFELVPYREDSFYWSLTYDETVKLARDPAPPEEYHILWFGSDGGRSGIDCLWWKHEPGLPWPGEIFKKTEESSSGRAEDEL